MEKEEAARIRGKGLRRSARISELEEKTRLLALQKKAKNVNNSNANNSASNAANGTATTVINGNAAASSSKNAAPASRGAQRTTTNDHAKKTRGRKRKSLQEVAVSSIASHLFGQEGESSESPTRNGDKRENLQWMPKKQTLELILDILQRRDTHEIFAQPVDPKEVEGYYSVIKEPMDFGTMRAKLQEGMYTSLGQFERDVFLIATNAMNFNAPNTIFYAEARALNELAHRVFRSLRNEPEKFELDYLGTRKRADKRPLVAEVGGSQSKHAKLGGIIDGAGSKDGKHFNSSETEKRSTYRPQTSDLTQRELTVSGVDSDSKHLQYNKEAGGGYRESLENFSKDLGPAAQKIVNMKLSQFPIGPSYGNGILSRTTYLRPTPPNRLNLCAPFAPQGAHLHGFSGNKMSSNFVPNAPTGSYKGKMVCDSGNMNSSEGAAAHLHGFSRNQMSSSFVSSAPTGSYKGKTVLDSGKMNVSNHTFGGEMLPPLPGPTKAANLSRNMDVCGSSQSGKAVGSGDSVDLLIATIMQIGAKQNRYACYDYPSAADENLYGISGQPSVSQLGTGFQSGHEYNKHSQPMFLPPQTTNRSPSIAKGTSSFFNGFHAKQYPNGEGPSAIGGGSSDYWRGTANYNNIHQSQSVHQFQPADWSQQAPWGLEAICNPGMLQSQAQVIPSGRGQTASMQQQQYQYYCTPGTSAFGQQGKPLFEFDRRTSFLGGHREVGSSSNAAARQGFWNAAQSQPSCTPRVDSQQPDLDLQL